MGVRISVPHESTFTLPLPRDAAFRYLTSWEKAIQGNFPGVEEFESKGPNTYRWRFESFSYGGYDFAVGFTTRFDVKEPSDITMVPVPDSGGSTLQGSWHLEEKGAATEVRFRATLELELPIPFFMKGMATPITQKEIGKLFQRYVDRVAKNSPTA